MRRKKGSLRLNILPIIVLISITLLTVALPAGFILASSGNLINPGFETGNLTGWSTGTVSDGVSVVGPESLVTGLLTPPEGSYMARLGTATADPNIPQPNGPNQIYQSFVASEPGLSFVYDIYTWDYEGYNHFEYNLIATDTGAVIASYSQGAWGSGEEAGILKSTGWRRVTIDISGYIGRPLRLTLNCGGTEDDILPTWAYIDLSAPVTPSNLDLVMRLGDSETIVKEITTPPGNPTDVWWEVVSDTGLSLTITPNFQHDVSGNSTIKFNEIITVANNGTLIGHTLHGTVTFLTGTYPAGGQPIGSETISIQVPPLVPGVSQWGIVALVVLLSSAMVWVGLRRQVRNETH